MLQGPGENAGVLDLGDGEAVAFKVESHNHPSAVEPFQGAATGVGGILRDISAMGARPVALLDGLRFGAPDHHFSRAVEGIGAYGNSVGVPTVGGEAVFDPSYADNVLVNAMCVGLFRRPGHARKATRAGSLVVLYGATTGRDGIGGASVLASQELGEGAGEKRPSVQVGDPFTGNRLIEVSVELVERGLVESLQDCGAAGLASSLSEMAADYGIDVELDRVPLREAGMEPWEVMISESRSGWSRSSRPSGCTTSRRSATVGAASRGDRRGDGRGLLRALWEDEVVGEIPARLLTDECPRYAVEREPRPAPAEVAAPRDPTGRRRAARAARLAGSPPARSCTAATTTSSSRAPCGARDSTRRCCGCARRTAGWRSRSTDRVAWPRSTRAPAARSRSSRRRGTWPAPAVSRSGFTDCLNFGNPEKPEIGWELAEAIEGMAEACEALGLPVVSGNVSLYNDTDGRSIHPTPVVGCVGLVPDVRHIPDAWREGDGVYLASASAVSLAGSEAQARWGSVGGATAALDLQAEAELVRLLWETAPRCSLVHDAAEGGLAVALAEAAIHSGIGAELDLDLGDPVALFGEGGGQAILASGEELDVPRIGTVGGATLLGVPVAELRNAWEAVG